MRSVRSCLWLSAFLLGASAPAFCQVIFPPNTSGYRIAADAPTSAYQQSVYSTGAFDVGLAVYLNGQLKFAASGLVCTSGPMTNVSVNVPFGCFGLKSGDSVLFIFVVRHRSTEGGSCSAILSLIPVGPSAAEVTAPPKDPPPTSGTKLWRPGGEEYARWARREDPRVG